MTKKYLGVKLIDAWLQEKDGAEGYAVKYPDGYTSWSPKEAFEAAYFPLGDLAGSCITRSDVENMLGECAPTVRMGNHSVVFAETRAGFTIVEDSACVSPENYDEVVGANLAREKIVGRVWAFLGFVLSWGKNGLRQ